MPLSLFLRPILTATSVWNTGETGDMNFTFYLLVSTILKVKTQLQILYSEWLDQDLVGWIQCKVLSNNL